MADVAPQPREAFASMRSGDVDLWVCSIEALRECPVPAEIHATLDAQALDRSKRFVDPRARERHDLAHRLVRALISAYLDAPPDCVRLACGVGGKPRLAAPERLARTFLFNLSHADGLIAVAIAKERDIGVDVEEYVSCSGSSVDLYGLARAFAPCERVELGQLTPQARRSEVLRLWTLKEAVAKATGRGLALPLSAAVFPTACSPERRPDLAKVHGSWHFVSWAVGRRGWLGCAISAPSSAIRLIVYEAAVHRTLAEHLDHAVPLPASSDGRPRTNVP